MRNHLAAASFRTPQHPTPCVWATEKPWARETRGPCCHQSIPARIPSNARWRHLDMEAPTCQPPPPGVFMPSPFSGWWPLCHQLLESHMLWGTRPLMSKCCPVQLTCSSNQAPNPYMAQLWVILESQPLHLSELQRMPLYSRSSWNNYFLFTFNI